MSESNQEKSSSTARIVATANLTEKQVNEALVSFVSQDDKLSELLKDQKSVAWINWHVNKWDSPERFATISFGVVNQSDEESSPAEPKDEL